MIAYTIGNKKNYDKLISSQDTFKVGKTDDYKGGIIFLSKQKALDFLSRKDFNQFNFGDNKPKDPNNFDIYCIEINSINDLYFEEENYYLLYDRKLFFEKLT